MLHSPDQHRCRLSLSPAQKNVPFPLTTYTHLFQQQGKLHMMVNVSMIRLILQVPARFERP